MSSNGAPVLAASVVVVDVGKNTAALTVTARTVTGCSVRRVCNDRAGIGRGAAALCAVLPAGPVKVAVEAAGHYHRPLQGDVVQQGQTRRVQGRRR
jgi:transposase